MKRLSYVDLHHQGTAQAPATGPGLTGVVFLKLPAPPRWR
jgi:hypothetical protein